MIKRLTFLLTVITTALVLIISANQSFASVKGAQSFVESISTDVLEILQNKSYEPSEKEDKLNQLFERVVDIKWIGKFVAGRYWRGASKSQKADYTKYYNLFLKQSYVSKFRSYTDQKIHILKVRPLDDKEYIVETEIVSSNDNEQPIQIDYKIRQSGNGYQVFDIIAEGISLITTQRADFDAILSRKGIGYLIDRLKAKVQNS